MRIVTLLARHGTEKYQNAVQDMRTLFAQQMPEVSHEIIIIDNALDSRYSEILRPKITLIGGDNTAWEFSAWDSGLAFLRGRLEEYDFIHLATSAFRQLYVRYLDLFDADMLGLIRGRAAAVGHVDYFNEPVELFGRSSQSWIRSSFVLLPPTELLLLGSLVTVEDRKTFFSGDPAAPFRADAPLSEGFRQNIIGWLTGAGTGQGAEWHSRFVLSPETLDFFEAKVLAVLNEHSLTLRLKAQGCNIVDATWLASCAEAFNLNQRFLSVIPDWRLQVTGRRTDAAPASLLA